MYNPRLYPDSSGFSTPGRRGPPSVSTPSLPTMCLALPTNYFTNVPTPQSFGPTPRPRYLRGIVPSTQGLVPQPSLLWTQIVRVSSRSPRKDCKVSRAGGRGRHTRRSQTPPPRGTNRWITPVFLVALAGGRRKVGGTVVDRKLP